MTILYFVLNHATTTWMVARTEGGIREHQALKRFTASAGEVTAKDQIDLMSRCWFSLKPGRTEPIEHQYDDRRSGRTETVKITTSSENGIATIHDQDLLIFAISQWVDAMKLNLAPSRRIHFTPYQFLSWLNREPSGSQYKRIREALNRLKATTIETTIRSEKGRRTQKRTRQFSWISEWEITEENGEIRGVEVVLTDWLFESVQEFHVLTLDKRYFDITGTVDRWLYLYAKKATGNAQGFWKETFRSLYRKSASQQAYKHYASSLRKLVQKNELPGFQLEQTTSKAGDDMLVMRRIRDTAPVIEKEQEAEQQFSLLEKSPLEETWENVLEMMRGYYGPQTVKSWLEGLYPIRIEEQILHLRAPTQFIAEWIENHYEPRLRDCLRELGHEVQQFRFEVIHAREEATAN